MRKLYLGLLMIVGVMAACAPALTEQDKRDLTYIQQAFSNLTAQSSVHTAGNMGVNMIMSVDSPVGVIEARLFYTFTFAGLIAYGSGFPNAVDATLKIDSYGDLGSLGGNTQGGTTVDLILGSGQTWMRLRDSSGIMADMDTSNWQMGAAGNFGNVIESSTVTGLLNVNQLTFPLNEQTVQSLTRLENKVLEGQVMRGYRVVFDINGILDLLDNAGLVNALEISGTAGMGLGDFVDDIFDDMTYAANVYIGEDDIVHAMELDMGMNFTVTEAGMNADAVIDIDATLIYSEFNVPVEIQLPQ
jgi:hypothetical protein